MPLSTSIVIYVKDGSDDYEQGGVVLKQQNVTPKKTAIATITLLSKAGGVELKQVKIRPQSTLHGIWFVDL